jgi:hypothetical protein
MAISPRRGESAGELEVGDVGADDDEHEEGAALHHAEVERGEIAVDLVEEGLDLDGAAFVGGGVEGGEVLAEDGHLGLSLLEGDAFAEASVDDVSVGVAVSELGGGGGEGKEEVGAGRVLEGAWKDADDGDGMVIELDGAAEGGRFGVEVGFPEGEAEDGDVVAAREGFGRVEGASEEGLGAQDGEELGGGVLGVDVGGFAAAGKGEVGGGADREAFKGLTLALPVEEVGEGYEVGVTVRLGLVERDDAVEVGDGERAEDDGVHDAEGGGVDADADGQGKDRREGEAGGFPELAEGIANVLQEGFHGVSDGVAGDRRACSAPKGLQRDLLIIGRLFDGDCFRGVGVRSEVGGSVRNRTGELMGRILPGGS